MLLRLINNKVAPQPFVACDVPRYAGHAHELNTLCCYSNEVESFEKFQVRVYVLASLEKKLSAVK